MVAGGVLYESQQVHQVSDLVPDWHDNRGMSTDMMESGSSSTYSTAPESHQSSYDVQSGILAGHPNPYPTPYPTMSGSHLPMQMPQYQRPHYHTPSSSMDYGNYYQDEYIPQVMYDPQPLLTNTPMRMYDTTIPTYYPVVPDQRSWNQTPVKEEKTGTKRKRASSKKTPPPSGRLVKTPKKTKEDGPTAKRAKEREQSQHSQLPTPPSSGREIGHVSLPAHLQPIQVQIHPQVQESVPVRARGVVVTRHAAEGRKLGLVGVASTDNAEPAEMKRSPRTMTVPALSTSESGLATVSTGVVLESEMAWLQDSFPKSADQIRTPVMTDQVLLEEGQEIQEEKKKKRLQAFTPASPTTDMVSTRVGAFGRVAVRKDTAAKFLGLDGSDLIEEKEEDEWRPVAGSSKAKPSWPDQLAPWSLAGGGRKERIQRETEEKAALLKRYLESSSDDDSDDELVYFSGKGKGKSINLLPGEAKRRLPTHLNTSSTNAKDALLISIRNRPLPPMQNGVVACVCGSPSMTMGSLIACASCKTWHHIVCCGFEDETQVGSQWWCASCEHQAKGVSTPAHRANRPMYAQSDERSAFKSNQLSDVALAPSPMFAAKTPHVGRTVQSPGRPQRSRVLSYGVDMWALNEDAPPSTPSRLDRFSTPRIDDAPFDVTSTPSRHIDFSFGQPSLFSLTPLGGRSRVTSHLGMDFTPANPKARNPALNASFSEALPKNDFFRELNKGPATVGGAEMGSPSQARWHGLMGAHNLSPSPFSHRRSVSGNKLSSMRSSSRSGLGFGMGDKKDEEVDDV